VLGLAAVVQGHTLWGLNGFPVSFPGIFLPPVLLFYLFWGRNQDIGHVIRFPPGILFPFSKKQEVF